MFFSVVMPVYNNGRFLKNAVDSILEQDFSDFELILVDDGSTDDSAAIVDECAKHDSRVKAVHQKNQGPAAARNCGIRQANGTYLLFIDSDDEYKPGVFSYLASVLSKKEYDVLCFGYDIIKKSGGELKLEKTVRLDQPQTYETRAEIEKAALSIIDLRILFSSTCTKAYKTALIKENRLTMPESIRIGEDYCFNLEVLRFASSYCFCDRVFYRYISQNESSIITSFHKDKFDQLLVVHGKRKEFLCRMTGIPAQERDASVKMDYIRLCFSCFMDLYASGCPLRHTEKMRYISEKKNAVAYAYSKADRIYYHKKEKIVHFLFAQQKTWLLALGARAFYIMKFLLKRSID